MIMAIDKLKFYTTLYGSLHKRRYVPNILMTPLRRVIRYVANKRLRANYGDFVLSTERNEDVIVSLTSFPKRINDIHYVIWSLLKQTVLPHKIILWLSNEQFESIISLPQFLLRLQNEVFEIRFVDKDIRSHKKYFYVFKEFPNKDVILVDDDIFYPVDMVEELCNAHTIYPNSIISRYAYRIRFKNGMIDKYKNWERLTQKVKGQDLFFGSGGGTYLSPRKLYKDVLNSDLFLHFTPYADDLWLNAMARLNNIDIVLITADSFLPVYIEDNDNLYSANVDCNNNDVQLSELNSYYLEKINRKPF